MKKDDNFTINCNHDEYSLWFDLNMNHSLKNGSNIQADERSLGATIVSRNRLGQINDTQRTNMLYNVLAKVLIIPIS